MDTQTLVAQLRDLRPEELTWKFALYNTRKGRDGVELEWSLCKMRGVATWVDALRITLLEKTTVEKTVAEYSPFLSDKEHIGAMEKSNELVQDQILDIVSNIQNGLIYAPEEYITGALPRIVGYGFYGESRDAQGKTAQQTLFMRRGNPFLSGGKAQLFISNGDEMVACEKPLLKLTPVTDFLLINDTCYFLSAGIEKDFAFESRHIAIANRCLGLIADVGVVNDLGRLEQSALKPVNAKKFTGFEKEILDHIIQLDIVEREEYLSTYGVTIDNNGRIDTKDSDQCELIIDLLCCRSILDPLGRLSVGSNIIPRE